MIRTYTDPLMIDYIQVCIQMPQDERDQVTAFSGHEFNIDGVAVGNFMVQGPKWVVKDDDKTLVVGGFKPQRPGVWRDYMLTTPAAWNKEYGFTVTRICRRAMDSMFTSGMAHRIECLAPVSRLQQRPELERWYRLMGYEPEGIRFGYGADGSNAMAFARVK